MKNNLDLIRMDWMPEQDQKETVEGKVPLAARILYKLTHQNINLKRLGVTVFLIVTTAIAWRLTAIPNYNQSDLITQIDEKALMLQHVYTLPDSALSQHYWANKTVNCGPFRVSSSIASNYSDRWCIEIVALKDEHLLGTKYETSVSRLLRIEESHVLYAFYKALKPGMIVEFELSDYDLNSYGEEEPGEADFLIPHIVE